MACVKATLYIPLLILYCRWTWTLSSGEEAPKESKRCLHWLLVGFNDSMSTVNHHFQCCLPHHIRSCRWLLNHTEFLGTTFQVKECTGPSILVEPWEGRHPKLVTTAFEKGKWHSKLPFATLLGKVLWNDFFRLWQGWYNWNDFTISKSWGAIHPAATCLLRSWKSDPRHQDLEVFHR